MSSKEHSSIMLKLGELLGEQKGTNQRLDAMNGTLENQGKRLRSLEQSRSRLKGAISVMVLGVTVGVGFIIKLVR